MSDLDLRLDGVPRSCQPLRYIRRWISRKPLETEAWFQRTTNRKWHMGYQMVTWPRRRCEVVRSSIPATAWLPVLLITDYLLIDLLSFRQAQDVGWRVDLFGVADCMFNDAELVCRWLKSPATVS